MDIPESHLSAIILIQIAKKTSPNKIKGCEIHVTGWRSNILRPQSTRSILLSKRLNWRLTTTLVSLFRWETHYNISQVVFWSGWRTFVKLLPSSFKLLDAFGCCFWKLSLCAVQQQNLRGFQSDLVAEWDQIMCWDVDQSIKLLGRYHLLEFLTKSAPTP